MSSIARLTGSSNLARPLWGALCEHLSTKLTVDDCEALQKDLRQIEERTGALRVGLPSSTLGGWLTGGQLNQLRSSVNVVSGGRLELAVSPFDAPAPPLPIDPTHTFARFIVGPSNQEAHAAVEAAMRSAVSGRSPLFLHGPPGSGKTHLLHATAHALSQASNADVTYVTANDLCNDLIAAISDHALERFRWHYQRRGALIIDNIAALTGRDATQSELHPIFEALAAQGTPVIVAAREAPAELEGFSDALRARLGAGLVTELHPPEWETRVAILLDRAKRWSVAIEPDVASFMVARAGSNLDALDLFLTRLLCQRELPSALVDVDLVARALERGHLSTLKAPPSAVTSLVARHFNLRVRDLRSSSRSRRITLPRQVAMYLMREHCALSFPDIGRRFGRHHTTVLHSCRRIASELRDNGNLRAALSLMEKELVQMSEEGG
jgi:chromosomal replication initiator protein